MLRVENIHFAYTEREILKGVCLTVAPGELHHIQGKNGAGKTTLLKIMAGIIAPDAGHVSYSSTAINASFNLEQRVSYVGHLQGFSSRLTVMQNCKSLPGLDAGTASIASTLKTFNLERLHNKRCFELSAGQRRRLSLARLTLQNAWLWLLDEPFVSLDSDSITRLAHLITQHINRGGAVVMTSHQALPEPLMHANRVQL